MTNAGSPIADGFAMPAEWAPHRRTWMCWPCRLEAWGGEEAMLRAKQAYARVARAISALEPVAMAVRPHDVAETRLATGNKVEIFETALDGARARDTGPTFLTDGRGGLAAVQWRFNAWGGKYAAYDEDARLAGRIARVADARLYEAALVCEGGAIHTDGEGTFIATEQTLLNPNRNPGLTREMAEAALGRFAGAQRVVWLGEGFADGQTDGHVDNIACFVAPGRVLVGVPASHAHPDHGPVREAIRRLARARDARGRAFEIVEVEQPQTLGRDPRGRLLPASYVNFYLPNGGVAMPAFSDRNDERARAVLADCFPGRDILQIDALDIAAGGGGIHGITQQEPAP